MRIFTGWVTSLLFFILGMQTPSTQVNAPLLKDDSPKIELSLLNVSRLNRESIPTKTNFAIVFNHGNIDWLTELATTAGWPAKTHKKLGEIILRESGGCPNRRGGDVVDKGCNITGVSEWNHRSDTGLLQINGVNYDISRNKWAIACTQMKICTQEPLLDPVANLKVGYLMYQDSGWDPWDPCTWDKTKCPKKKP